MGMVPIYNVTIAPLDRATWSFRIVSWAGNCWRKPLLYADNS